MLNNTFQRIKSMWNDNEPQRDYTPQQMQELEPRMLLSATLVDDIPDVYISASGGTAAIDLDDYFDDDEISGTIVRFNTVYGSFDVELFDDATPVTVANFLSYLDSSLYNDTFIHRNAIYDGSDIYDDGTPFVVQGGGFYFESPNKYLEIEEGDSILNEPGISNTRGTIAMAKLGGDPDSATSQWFFNMSDNSEVLDDQNGGFTAFGQVLGDGMDILDLIAATPIWDASSLHSALGELPLIDFDNTYFPDEDNLVMINSVTRAESELTYSIVDRSEPERIAATVDDNGVVTIFTIGTSIPETVTITVEATDYNGNTVQSTITINIGAAQNSLAPSKRLADLMWRDFSTGNNILYDMKGVNIDTIIKDFDNLSNTTFYIAAIADFNQDGENDILWRNAFDGRNRVWLMDGTTVVDTVELQAVTNRKVVITGAGDFNNDGHTDILWRNTKNGKNFVWLMDGTANVDSMQLEAQAGSQWYVGGVGDFDRDGATDIIWRNNETGQNKIWLLNAEDGSLKESVAVITESNTGWVMCGVGDYNVDNRIDIVWRNVNNGSVMLWIMDGTSYRNARKGITRVRNQDRQLPGYASQLKAQQQAQVKIQRIKRHEARLAAKAAASASVTMAAMQAAQETESVLTMVEPIISLDDGEDANLL